MIKVNQSHQNFDVHDVVKKDKLSTLSQYSRKMVSNTVLTEMKLERLATRQEETINVSTTPIFLDEVRDVDVDLDKIYAKQDYSQKCLDAVKLLEVERIKRVKDKIEFEERDYSRLKNQLGFEFMTVPSYTRLHEKYLSVMSLQLQDEMYYLDSSPEALGYERYYPINNARTKYAERLQLLKDELFELCRDIYNPNDQEATLAQLDSIVKKSLNEVTWSSVFCKHFEYIIGNDFKGDFLALTKKGFGGKIQHLLTTSPDGSHNNFLMMLLKENTVDTVRALKKLSMLSKRDLAFTSKGYRLSVYNMSHFEGFMDFKKQAYLQTDKKGNTALHIATANNSLHYLPDVMLSSMKDTVYLFNRGGKNAIMLAVENKMISVDNFELLIKKLPQYCKAYLVLVDQCSGLSPIETLLDNIPKNEEEGRVLFQKLRILLSCKTVQRALCTDKALQKSCNDRLSKINFSHVDIELLFSNVRQLSSKMTMKIKKWFA